MQNKPNLLNAQINVSSIFTKDYENVHLLGRRKNKANQTQPVVSLPAMSVAERVEPISNFLLGMSYGENYVL